MTNEEIIGHCVALTLGGLETTGNFIANGAVALLRHPDQFAMLRADPDLLTGAVEEMLRWDSPAQGTFRTALAPFKVDDVEVPEGARVQLLWGSANRDDQRFPDGDRFLVQRPASAQHLAFGLGIHFCVGMVLARAEARAAFICLSRDAPGIEMSGEPVLKTALMPVIRGHVSVPVSIAQ